MPSKRKTASKTPFEQGVNLLKLPPQRRKEVPQELLHNSQKMPEHTSCNVSDMR
jgi:hypothetical protein